MAAAMGVVTICGKIYPILISISQGLKTLLLLAEIIREAHNNIELQLVPH